MNFKNKKIQKAISGAMVLAMLLPSIFLLTAPKKTDAFLDPIVAAFTKLTSIFTGSTAVSSNASLTIQLKDVAKEVANQALKVIAKRALANITKSTVNWINSGFHGAPLFVQNPQSLFKDITRSEIKDLIGIIGYDQLRFPFGKQFALNTIDSYKRQLSTNAEYSLSRVVNDPTLLINYRNNFYVGGWDGFVLNTQYPNNNYYGSQMQLNNELGRRLQGTNQNAAAKVATTLQQGQGFLSPQICPADRNPNYPTNTNPFNPPSFNDAEYKTKNPYNPPTSSDQTIVGTALLNQITDYDIKYNAAKASAKAKFDADYSCPGGLVTTTPGSVVANSIMTSLSSGTKLTELQAALGGSLSAVFDALLNKFLGSGLSSLASKINPPPSSSDNFDYLGNSLGSSDANYNGYSGDVFNTPDQIIKPDEFRKEVKEALENTRKEILLLDNDPYDANNPNKQSGSGMLQFMAAIWPKARELDICIPGPDIGFEDRLTDEMGRNSQKLQEKASDEDGDKAFRASVVIKELKFAVDIFKDWLQTTSIKSGPNDLGLPSSIIFLDAVREATDLGQQSKQVIGARNSKTSAKARLEAIDRALAAAQFNTEPARGSQAEKDLIAIRKQYDAAFPFISTPNSVDDTQNELNTLSEKYTNVNKLVGDCTKERIAKGWTVPTSGNWANTLANKNFVSQLPSRAGKLVSINLFVYDKYQQANYPSTGEEIEQFCTVPITGGYKHGTFISLTNPPQYPELPMVNAGRVYSYSSGLLSLGSSDVNITIQCNAIFRANTLDYKGDLPSLPNTNEPVQPVPLPSGDIPGLTPNGGTNNTPPGGNPGGGTYTPPDTSCGDTEPCG